MLADDFAGSIALEALGAGVPVGYLPIQIECGSAWKKDPVSGVIGVEKGPLIPVV
jgi:hypothetical protein